jgi:hypothetical protein
MKYALIAALIAALTNPSMSKFRIALITPETTPTKYARKIKSQPRFLNAFRGEIAIASKTIASTNRAIDT